MGSEMCIRDSHASAPCTATANQQTAAFVVNFSEAIDASTFTIADINGGTAGGAGTICKDELTAAAAAGNAGNNTQEAEISAVGVAGSSFLVRLWIADSATAAEDGQACVIEAGETISIVTTGITDRSTNAGTTTKTKTMHAVLDADVAKPVMTTTVTCTRSSDAIIKRGILTADAGALGNANSVIGNTYSMKVSNSRGLRVPTIDINTTTKVIHVTADLAYTSVADVAKAHANANGTTNWTFVRSGGSAGDAIGTSAVRIANATILSAGSTAGVQGCSMKLTSSEQIRTENDTALTAAIVFGGTQIVAASALTFSTQLNTVTSASFAPATPVTAASVSYTLSAASLADSKGNTAVLAGNN